MRHYILNEKREAVAVDLETWVNWFQGKSFDETKRVAETQVGTIRVSTVFLGSDHNWEQGRPLIFETMCFDTEGGEFDEEMERYSTWDEAVAGHEAMVRKVKGE